jgi:hypothetical protein
MNSDIENQQYENIVLYDNIAEKRFVGATNP